jgi:uncharacterized protein with PIN domain
MASTQTAPLRFILEPALERLARNLRLAGFDSVCALDGERQALLDRARDEFRVLVIRDGEFSEEETSGLRTCRVSGDEPGQLLRDVLAAFEALSTARSGSGFFTRCIDCNSELLLLPREVAEQRLPSSAMAYAGEVRGCRRCERSYWETPYWQRMRAWLRDVLSDPSHDS